MSSLSDTLISDTFDSLLHANGNILPVSGQVSVYDGGGNKSSLSIGRDTNGITVGGRATFDQLTVGTLQFPSSPGTVGNLVYQETATTLGFISTIPTASLQTLSPSPEAIYSLPIKSINVNSKGLVTNITEYDNYRATANTVAHHAALVSVTGSSNPIILPANSNEWVKIDLTNNGVGDVEDDFNGSVLSTTRAVTLFIRSSGKIVHGGKTTFIQAASNPTTGHTYPVLFDIPTNSSDERGMSAIFRCPVTRETIGGAANHAVIYLRNQGGGESTVNATSWVLTIVAQHI